MPIKLRNLAIAAATAALVSCGGGGSVDDGTVDLTVTPSNVDISSSNCRGVGAAVRVMIYGGVEPYTIHNPVPNHIQLSRTFVEDSGDSVDIFLLGKGCLDAIPFTITDADANTTTFSVTHTDSSD